MFYFHCNFQHQTGYQGGRAFGLQSLAQGVAAFLLALRIDAVV